MTKNLVPISGAPWFTFPAVSRGSQLLPSTSPGKNTAQFQVCDRLIQVGGGDEQ